MRGASLWKALILALVALLTSPAHSTDHGVSPHRTARDNAESPGGRGPPPQLKHKLSFLDQMLAGHDRRAWPTYGTGTPTMVRVNIYINSLSSISAANMEYNMDMYLRQSWQDSRLDVSRYGVNDTMTLNGEDIVDRIWRPDLFFRNVKSASFHKVTVPNMLIKMGPNGEILYSMRLTLRLSCHMSFRHYPLDTQKCHIVVGSYAQTVDQVNVKWQAQKPIVIEMPVELPEFDLVGLTYSNFTRVIDTGAFSFLNATFTLARQNGYHLVQTYLPTFLIVTISWVSFWLNVDATPARVTLGVTTLLTLTTVASGVRTQLPPVSYVKAIDVWIGACSVMVFGALLEFTLVNYLSRSKMKPAEFRRSINIFQRQKGRGTTTTTTTTPESTALNGEDTQQQQPPAASARPRSPATSSTTDLARNVKRSKTVDRVCRVMFPVVFFIFNIVYWLYYLYVPDVH